MLQRLAARDDARAALVCTLLADRGSSDGGALSQQVAALVEHVYASLPRARDAASRPRSRVAGA
ncbi:MAG: hypothetical protein M3292_02975, partial [Actinomycetota bacterium]|nr:hypothetical protein [Actinomycetota bacterium]